MYVVIGEDWVGKEDIVYTHNEMVAKKIVKEITERINRGYQHYPCYFSNVSYRPVKKPIICDTIKDITDFFGWKKLLTNE